MFHDAALTRLAPTLASDARFAAAIAFGSRVRGTARADSDLDIASLLTAAGRASWDRDPLRLLGELGRRAGCDVHLIDLEVATLDLRYSIFARGVRLFDRSGERLAELERRTMIEWVDTDWIRRWTRARQRELLESYRGRS